jgi:hypothetical protein
MTDEELVEVVNQRAATEARFRARLREAVAARDRGRLRGLIDEAARGVFESVGEAPRRGAEDWFLLSQIP